MERPQMGGRIAERGTYRTTAHRHREKDWGRFGAGRRGKISKGSKAQSSLQLSVLKTKNHCLRMDFNFFEKWKLKEKLKKMDWQWKTLQSTFMSGQLQTAVQAVHWTKAPYLGVKVKVKVAQSCPALCKPMDYRVHGILQGIFPTQGSNPGLPHGRWTVYQLSHKGSPTWGWISIQHHRHHRFTYLLRQHSSRWQCLDEGCFQKFAMAHQQPWLDQKSTKSLN